MSELQRKTTPADVSEFERERLRFLLDGDDAATILTEINPSLAWLPLLAETKVFQNNSVLPLWVEKNFGSLDAVRDVVENLRFFNAESGRILKYRLQAQRERITPLLTKSWELIVRHIENEQQGRTQNQWFELLPRIKQGDLSTELLSRIVRILTPKLFVEKRYGWYDEADSKVEKPTDLLSIKYRVEDGVGEDDFFSAWPKDAPIETKDFLVRALTSALSAALADAIEVGVEIPNGLGITDIDVPSVAAHKQNSYHDGFLPVVRIIAELWSTIAQRDAGRAKRILEEWIRSEFRLIRRIALYAAADQNVDANFASDLLLSIPQGELFLTNSEVEVHRLIRARWTELPPHERRQIEARLIEGPPRDWFQTYADYKRALDRRRFIMLLDIESSDAPLGNDATQLLADIRRRHPDWTDVPSERAGFAIWQGEATNVVGKPDRLESIPSDQLLKAAKATAIESELLQGDAWQAFCQSHPLAALDGIEAASNEEKWEEWAWRPLLWAATDIPNTDVLNRIGTLLGQWPAPKPFANVANGAAYWMDHVAEKLEAPTLWKLWDLIELRSPRRSEANGDIFTTALNDPAGHLASVLLKRTEKPKGVIELGKSLRDRYVKLIEKRDFFALLAMVRISAAISFLFERAPSWTTAHILPSYEWTLPEAAAMWSARKYSNHIGSKQLFLRTKTAFLELFVQPNVPDEDIRVFSGWLAIILIANQAGRTDYSLAATEVRSVLRKSSSTSLGSFAHQLAIEMESVKESEKLTAWHNVVGPVFQRAWPLDVELQTPRATFKLVQLLLATGSAFGDAARAIIPFLRTEDAGAHSSLFSISEAPPALYAVAPKEMINLLVAVAGDSPNRSQYGMNKALDKVRHAAPELEQTNLFRKLEAQASY